MPEYKVPKTPFRFWCQKVLPLVYDDSLSYYELLAKVVEYLNNTMSDVITLEDFVTNYFDNLDVQEEINNKLDAMAIDGSLTALVARYVDPKIEEFETLLTDYQAEITGEFSEYKTDMTSDFNELSGTVLSSVDEMTGQINVLESRMDEFTNLPEGSTAGDAELADIRVAWNSITYDTAGNAVRNQAEDIFNELSADESVLNFQVVLPCVDGNLGGATPTASSAKKRGKLLKLNNKAVSSLGRYRITGQFAYATNAPSPANHPDWYGTEQPFILGHEYHIQVHLLSGSYDQGDITDVNYIDMRDSSSNTKMINFDGGNWVCNFVPEMICLGVRNYTYNNAVFYVEITDLTAKNALVPDEDSALSNRVTGDEKVLLNQVMLPCPASSLSSSGLTYKYSRPILEFDGSMVNTRNRFNINNFFAYSAVAPSYDNVPTWYTDPINQFTLGHKYRIKPHLISGSYNLEEGAVSMYFDLRTSDGYHATIAEGRNNWIFDCTFLPEMICFGTGIGTYDDTTLYIEITDLTAIVEDSPLKDYVHDPYEVPEYFEEELSTAETAINNYINANKVVNYGTDIEAFIFLTDVHWNNNAQKSPALIKHIIENCPVQTVVCGGDIIYSHNNTKKGAVTEVRDFIGKITGIPLVEYYGVYGNHDTNSNGNTDYNTMFTADEEFNLYYSMFAYKDNVRFSFQDYDTLTNPITKNDFYFDHPRTKTRYLCLDWKNPFTPERADWVTSVLSRDDGYRVIVIYHGIYKHADSGSQELEHYQIMPVLEPFKDKIVALFTGHTHQDYIGDYYGDGSVPIIITGADMLTPDKTEGTATEQCIDVAIINYNTSTINLVRIGAGSDRSVTFELNM